MLIQSALVALSATAVAALQPLTVKGNQFVTTAGDRFYITGVAYQPGGSAGYQPQNGKDPLSDSATCLRDAALMQILGVNAIRVYNLDPDLNHDACASIFNAAGIYMLLDVNSPLVGESLNSALPWESYYAAYLNRTFAVVEAFKNYPNTAAFFSGNEVINDEATGGTAPPYVRAVTRDLKNYIAKHADRSIPVGYSAADVRSVLFDSWRYFTCQESDDANNTSGADIFALNSYSWCGGGTYTTSGYDQLVAGFNTSSVPVFFSEYGCNLPTPRAFTEVPVIYGPLMTGALSGGVVYEYAQEPNNYGLVNISDDGSAQLMTDFYTLQKQYASIDFKSVQATAASTTTPTAVTCDASIITSAGFNTNFTLPVLPPGAADIIENGVSPAPVGKIIDVSSYSVSQMIKNVDGSVLSGLAVVPLANDAFNTPGAVTSASVTSTNSSTNASTTTSSSTSATSTQSGSGRTAVTAFTAGALSVVGAFAFVFL